MMGAVGVSFSPLGRAVGRRLAGGRDPDTQAEVEELRAEVAELRRELDDMHARLGQLDDVQNRLDFAERLLAQVKARGIGAGDT